MYPEGNYIRASDERPFLQIGESKYGKFMLELAVEAHVDLVTAAKIALGSMLSTARANLSVGPPYDIGFYFNDSRTLSQFRIESDSPLLDKLRKVWERHLLSGIAKLPAITQDDLTDWATRLSGLSRRGRGRSRRTPGGDDTRREGFAVHDQPERRARPEPTGPGCRSARQGTASLTRI